MTTTIAVISAIFIWWFATGAVIALARLGTKFPGTVMAIVTSIAMAGLYGLLVSQSMAGTAGTYLGFGSALALWAWHETTFLLGLITGPRRVALSQEPVQKSRFRAAFLTVRDHEIALALTALLLLVFLHDGGNLTGLLTFLLLWVMRISTKLNIYLGAEHAISDMLPDRLAYLKTYFRTDRTSRWFYASLAFNIAVLVVLVSLAVQTPAEPERVMWSLLATFCALALVEHLFLVLPVRDSALWAWAIRMCPVKSPATNITHSIAKQKTGEVPNP